MAGTHAGEETDWTKKEQEEQQYVTDYIEDVISEFTDEYSKEGPFTTMAANLYHLRTDFLFRLEDTDCLGDVLDALFPTPAICGIPKEETRQYILDHESINRKYYSGFVGPLMPSGRNPTLCFTQMHEYTLKVATSNCMQAEDCLLKVKCKKNGKKLRQN